MLRKLLFLAGTTLFTVGPALAWNRAGHMAMGAMAYDELRREAPASATRVAAMLRQHPQYESRWKPQMAGMSEQDQERFLFMQAARWPDDIRGDAAFDHPWWHFINYLYRPAGQPASLPGPPPAEDDIVAAFQRNVAAIQGANTQTPDQKAVALCWIFHLMGDSHQPLHAAALVTSQYPEGDRGGNLFFVRPSASSSTTQNLHAYWDNIILMDEHYDPARERALAIENGYPRGSLSELAEPHFETWMHKESFDLAVSTAYLEGKLEASTDKTRGAPLPAGYESAAKSVAERRLALSGYRMADLLRTNFP